MLMIPHHDYDAEYDDDDDQIWECGQIKSSQLSQRSHQISTSGEFLVVHIITIDDRDYHCYHDRDDIYK